MVDEIIEFYPCANGIRRQSLDWEGICPRRSGFMNTVKFELLVLNRPLWLAISNDHSKQTNHPAWNRRNRLHGCRPSRNLDGDELVPHVLLLFEITVAGKQVG